LLERLAYDEQGQLLNTSFVDFLLPTTEDVPRVEVAHQETPSPLTPLGMKGLGEAGAIPGPALLASAIDDALRPLGVRIARMPLGPADLLALIEATGGRARAPHCLPSTQPGSSSAGWRLALSPTGLVVRLPSSLL